VQRSYDARVSPFVSGRELSRAFYEEVVRALIGDVEHSAGLLGWGSDVLGYDTERSTDHGWGPRMRVFVHESEVERVRSAVEAGLADEFRGWPTRYGWDDVPVSSHVSVRPLGEWLERQLGFDARDGLTTLQWLTTPQQLLSEVTGGEVFWDGTGELKPLRQALAWYPDDVWRWLVGCQWWRIDQEEPFIGRTAEVSDELGSHVIAARLARDAMRLGFLLERRYAPYAKWLGSAFARLDCAPAVGKALEHMLTAGDFEARESAWVEAIEALARRHNALGLTTHIEPTVRPFHSRPFRVIDAGRFAAACIESVSDSWLRELPRVGAIDQLVDSTDVLSVGGVARRVADFYGPTT
jgi:hypothetical protein